MTEAGELYDTLMCGLTGGVALAGIVAFARSRMPGHVRWSFILLFASAIAWLVAEGPMQRAVAEQSAILILLLLSFGVAAPGFFWLTIRVVFEDRRITPAGLLVPFALMALMTAQLLLELSTGYDEATYWMGNGADLLIAGHSLVMLLRGWRDDLVEGRRRLRGLLFLIFGLACLQLIMIVAAGVLNQTPWGSRWLIHACYTTLVLLAGLVASLFDVRRGLFAPAPVRTSKDGAEEDARALATLERLMTVDEFWRREGLSVADLAGEMGMAEHRLRKLINGHLGHRNFATFINSWRIQAGMRQLAEPANVRKTVAEIAYGLGFTSLNPFNRAFKEQTGETPTEWRRRQMLVESGKGGPASKSDETGLQPSGTAGPGTSEPRVH